MLKFHRMYVRIDGEPFLSRAKAYRAKFHARQLAVSAFGRERGAIKFPEHGRGLVFDGAPPPGWNKPSARTGVSQPRKGHADAAALTKLLQDFPQPTDNEVWQDTICSDLSYELPDRGYGSEGIGYIFGRSIGWSGDQFFAVIPDAEAAVRDHRASYPDSVITSGADTWRLPDGLTRLTHAEYNLALAQAAVEQEQKKATPRLAQDGKPICSPAGGTAQVGSERDAAMGGR